MGKFVDSVSFASADLNVLFNRKPLVLKRLLCQIVEMYRQKVIRPVTPITTMPMSAISQAMRMMQGGKHMGKLVIEARGDDIVKALPPPSPKAIWDEDASYLVTGGTGGLGRSITRWLAGQGAKNIVLASRSGIKQKGIPELIEELKAMDVNVVARVCDIADRSQVQNMIRECYESMPPIRGVIHGAMALRDALFDKISFEDWTLNIAPRVKGAWNLHECLSALNFFVILASTSGISGITGQTAYAASNTFLDAFSAYRQSLGLPACTIDVGIVESVGYVAENIDQRTEIHRAGHDTLSEAELLAVIKAAILNPTSPEYQQIITGYKLKPERPLPFWASHPKFAHVLHALQSQYSTRSETSKGRVSVRDLLKSASSFDSAADIIVTALLHKLTSLLALPVEDIDPKKPVVAYGLDSLVAVEFRNWINVELEANLPLMELMNSPSIEQLAGKLARKSKSINKDIVMGESSVDGEEKRREEEQRQ
ncbi:MAG: hypothetical protein Q9201_007201 [Fulgogasparrea decipioides]